MTEQPDSRQSPLELDDDEFSLTSTQSEKYASDEEFLVDSILAEKRWPDSRIYYLIRWVGYPEEKSTWEPKKHIQAPDVLKAWRERKIRETVGEEEPYDLVRYEALLAEVARKRKYRHKLRKVKRKRANLPVSPDTSDSESSEAREDENRQEDAPGIESKGKGKQLSAQKVKKQPHVLEQPANSESASSKQKREPKVVGSQGEAIQKKRAQTGSLSDERRPFPKKNAPVAHLEESRSDSAAAMVSLRQDPPLLTEVSSSTAPVDFALSQSERPALQSASSSSIGRGQGVKRGSSVGFKNVFFGGTMRKAKATFIEQSSDPTKKTKHLSNMHQRHRLQMQGRGLADKAPDLDALGGLYDPANPGRLPAMKPLILKNILSTNSVTQEANAQDIQPNHSDSSSPTENFLVSPPAGFSSTSTSPWPDANISTDLHRPEPVRPLWQRSNGRMAICWYWFKSGSCSKGDQCQYYHTDDISLPVIPEPGNRVSQPCAFFFKPRGCYRGERCTYSHTLPPSSLLSNSTAHQPHIFHPTANIPQPVAVDPPSRLSDDATLVHQWTVSPTDRGSPSLSLEPDTHLPPIPREAVDSAANEINTSVIEPERTAPIKNRKVVTFADTVSSPLAPEPVPADSTFQGSTNQAPETHHHTGGGPNEFSTSSRQNQPHLVASWPQPQSPIDRSALPDLLLDKTQHLHVDAPREPYQSATIVAEAMIPRLKMNLEDFRRKKAFMMLGTRAKEVFFGSEETQSIVLDFGDVEQNPSQPWTQTFASLIDIQFDHMCVAHDFQAQREAIVGQVLWQGNLVSDPSDQSAIAALARVSQELRMHGWGLISTLSEFAILVYSTGEEWKFMEGSTRIAADISLRYLIFQTRLQIGGHLQHSDSTSLSGHRKALAKAIHKLSFSKLLPKQVKGKPYLFFLLFPPSANQTAQFVVSWLKEAWPIQLCSVYTSQTKGSWNHFVSTLGLQPGIVLIHRSVISQVSDLPLIKELLSKQDMVNFWYIDDSSALYPAFSPPQTSSFGQITAAKVFPIFRNAIFLTPSLFVVDPDKALETIRWFQNKVKSTSPGNYKLVCPYKIQDYVLDLALDKAAERDDFQEKHRDLPTKDAMEESAGLSWKSCESRFSCHKYLVELLSNDVVDGYSNFYSSDYPNEDTSPIIFADESIDPDDEQALVKWFAFWTLTQLDKFRKFTVIGTSPTTMERARRVRVVSVAATPAPPLKMQSIKPLPNCVATATDKVDSFAGDDNSHSTANAAKLHVTDSQSTLPAKDPAHKGPDPFQKSRNRSPVPSSSSKFLSNESMHQDAFGTPSVSTLRAGKSRSPSGRVVGILGSHPVSLPEESRGLSIKGLAASMNQLPATTSINSNPSAGVATKHGFDIRTPPQNLEFCAITGSDLFTSKRLLEQCNNDVQRAVQLYYANRSTNEDSTERNIQELIASTRAGQTTQLLRLATTDAARAVEIYAATSTSEPVIDDYSPVLEQQIPLAISPQFNGNTDSRPHSSASASSMTSLRLGVIDDGYGNRSAPRHGRPSGTSEPERTGRPEFARMEEKSSHVSGRENSNPQYEVLGPQNRIRPGMVLKAYTSPPQNDSSLNVHEGDIVKIVKPISGIMFLGENTETDERGQVPEWIFERPVDYHTPRGEVDSPVSEATPPPVEMRDMMDIDLQSAILSEVGEDTGKAQARWSDANFGKSVDKNPGPPLEKQVEVMRAEKVVEKKIKEEVRFEATTEWYGRLKAEGKGWEHIYVDGWQGAFKWLGVYKD